MKKNNFSNGTQFSFSYAKVFFGNKNFKCQEFFEKKNSFLGKQIHDTKLVRLPASKFYGCSQLLESSDGLQTITPGQSLGIVTADCVPCFLVGPNQIFSLHLGWRSLIYGLLDKALSRLDSKTEHHLFIGPHIGFSSFQVSRDVQKIFKNNLTYHENMWSKRQNNSSYLISLAAVIALKCQNYNIKIFETKIDTYTNTDYYSYRRDNKTSERNISFAFLRNELLNNNNGS